MLKSLTERMWNERDLRENVEARSFSMFAIVCVLITLNVFLSLLGYLHISLDNAKFVSCLVCLYALAYNLVELIGGG